MWPPSSWAAGKRLSEVAKSPTQAARPNRMKQERARAMPGCNPASEEAQEQRSAKSQVGRCEYRPGPEQT